MADTHLDRDVLSALREVMEDEYPTLLDTFIADSEERLLVLRKAEDAAQLMNAAHSFKGSSSNMGAVRLAELCNELEQRAKDKHLAGIEKLVGEIDGEFAIVRPLYEAERQRSLAE
ncbi:Hpt domain-containing protein [Pseudomonas sp. ADAK2]|uniref:Hpt domain-containing protein n=1 Tax=Pseudomonas TaxID=286 RepID=UPI001463EE5C|nr:MULTISPECIES: Hpt domain-containing protein [unclassified Pseudomonas]QJI41650.1 Hpt domain-containing protein [Pseudomonas sp. ADAK7]QJI47954.1 Hpt domain-containing protein [Pseudomonas sp. ADAK2]